MVEIVWTEPALSDLDAIADYIALDNPEAAKALVQRVVRHVAQLASHPKRWRYRQIIEAPCRILYRYDDTGVYILYVMRGERRLRPRVLLSRSKKLRK